MRRIDRSPAVGFPCLSEVNTIEGLTIVPLKKVINERGHLLEVQRNDDVHFRGFGQAYITCTLPGVIKAWYRHREQLDQIALVKGHLLLALYDGREDSPSSGTLSTMALAEESPSLIQIPPGVWHGFKALGMEPLYLLHLNSRAMNLDQIDEERLPFETLSIPYQW